MIKIQTIGGYNEVGKNMTLVEVDDESVILDMGLHMEKYIAYTEDRENISDVEVDTLIKEDIVPNINGIDRNKVLAIIPTHAHLDHVGGVPFLAHEFEAPIIGTPFTIEVLKSILADNNQMIPNPTKILEVHGKYKLSKNIEIEFINSTHSTPETVMVALHTPYGTVVYANDFKFDEFPTLGEKTDIEKLRQFGNKHNVRALIVDSTYSNSEGKTPSESVARQMLKDVMLGTDTKYRAILVTTFASHIARLKSIVEFGKELNRKIVFMGRSLSKYVIAAQNVGIIDWTEDVKLVRYGKQMKQELRRITNEGKEKYLVVVTGHQGEPGSVLSRIASKELDFPLEDDDTIIFSCCIIPNKINQENRAILESKLKKFEPRIYKDIHASGHASKEDLRDLITLVQPEHIIPAHGTKNMRAGMLILGEELEYSKEKVHLLENGDSLEI